jgi:hypothetical protein
MRKLLLVSFSAALALILVRRPAAATNVNDYTNFTNSTSDSMPWKQLQYTPGPGDSVSWQGAISVNAGGTSDSIYTAPTQTNSSVTILWQNSDGSAVCTFTSRTSLNSFGNWQRYVTGMLTTGTGYSCNAPPVSSGPSSGYTFTYSVSN